MYYAIHSTEKIQIIFSTYIYSVSPSASLTIGHNNPDSVILVAKQSKKLQNTAKTLGDGAILTAPKD